MKRGAATVTERIRERFEHKGLPINEAHLAIDPDSPYRSMTGISPQLSGYNFDRDERVEIRDAKEGDQFGGERLHNVGTTLVDRDDHVIIDGNTILENPFRFDGMYQALLSPDGQMIYIEGTTEVDRTVYDDLKSYLGSEGDVINKRGLDTGRATADNWVGKKFMKVLIARAHDAGNSPTYVVINPGAKVAFYTQGLAESNPSGALAVEAIGDEFQGELQDRDIRELRIYQYRRDTVKTAGGHDVSAPVANTYTVSLEGETSIMRDSTNAHTNRVLQKYGRKDLAESLEGNEFYHEFRYFRPGPYTAFNAPLVVADEKSFACVMDERIVLNDNNGKTTFESENTNVYIYRQSQEKNRDEIVRVTSMDFKTVQGQDIRTVGKMPDGRFIVSLSDRSYQKINDRTIQMPVVKALGIVSFNGDTMSIEEIDVPIEINYVYQTKDGIVAAGPKEGKLDNISTRTFESLTQEWTPSPSVTPASSPTPTSQ